MKTKYFLILLVLLVGNVTFSQTTYYVDVDASDGGNGTTEGTAWNEISDVNGATFSPGDEILFNSGDVFYGKLIVPSSGDIDDQITFGKYGGTARPIINGRNYTACIDASKKSYITFNDLELINNSDDDTGIIDVSPDGKTTGAEYKRYGFYSNSGGAVRNNIILNDLEIHSIYPRDPLSGEYNGHGIQFTGWGNSDPNYFDGITIEKCEIYDTGILGISVNKWGNPVAPNIHKNITVRDNHIHHTGGSGIVYFEVDGFLIEDNLITYTGDYSMDLGHLPSDSRQRGRGSGFWNVRTSNGVLQYNEFSNAHGPKDSCGAHIDIGNDNIIIQYNLSKNNAGGFAEFMGDNTNCIYRYNVSINDGWRVKYYDDPVIPGTPDIDSNPEMFTLKGDSNGQVGAAVWFSNYYGCNGCDVPSTDNEVYNNTFYIGTYRLAWDDTNEIRPINAFLEFETGSDDNLIKNNIFYLEDGTNTTYGAPSTLSYFEESGAFVEKEDIDYNIFSNTGPIDGTKAGVSTAESYDKGDDDLYSSDPNSDILFVNTGSLNADDYMLTSSSDAIDNGVSISDSGDMDYWYNSLASVPSTDFDRGAHERSSVCSGDAIYTGSWSSSPSSSDQVYINSNYTLPNGGSFDACQLIVGQGATLTIPSDEYINVNGNITVNGTLIVENEGSVVQIDDVALVKNSGTITIEKISPLLTDMDFMILGSPMTEESSDGVFVDASFVRYHDTDLFTPHPDVEAEDGDAENFADDNGDNWVSHSGSLNAGEGYLVKPLAIGESDATITTNYTQGTLNNGIVNFTTIFGDDQNDSPNILSNPYASAVDGYEFIDNNTIVDAIYYWEHITMPNTSYPGYNPSNYNMGDISMYNLSGGTEAANSGGGPKPRNRFIPSGQGFAIKANAAGNVTFNNSMRLTGFNNGYRNNETVIDRLFLSIANNTYDLRSGTLIAFTELATNGYDKNYDAKRLATPVSLYTLNSDKELGIQGRTEFNEDHIIPLGFSTQVDENQEYTISINSLEGELISQATVYLKDNLLNTLTNLSETEYSFTSNKGHQTNRFVLVFESEPILNIEDLEQSITVYPNPANTMVTINSITSPIELVMIYDLQGRMIKQWTGKGVSTFQLDLSGLKTSIYLVKITTTQGSLTKRILKW